MANKFKTLGKVTVTAGTAVALSATDLAVSELCIIAKKANTGIIYIGDSTVTNSATTSVGGFPLAANERFPISGLADYDGRINLKDIYINSSVDAEGVVISYILRNQ